MMCHNIDSLIIGIRAIIGSNMQETKHANNILDIVRLDFSNSSPIITTSYYYNRIKYSLEHYIVWMYENHSRFDYIMKNLFFFVIKRRGGDVQYKMSISLNDHENRIKALENRKGYTLDILAHGEFYIGSTINLSRSMLDYDFIGIACNGTDGVNSSQVPNKAVQWLHRDMITDSTTISISCIVDMSSPAFMTIDRNTYNTIWPLNGKGPYGEHWYVRTVVGLKLYYSFSYNIILYRLMQITLETLSLKIK